MLELTLPYPPSANHYWRHSRGKFHISKRGLAFRENVLAEVWSALGKLEPIEVRLGMSILLTPPNAQRRDVDNAQKPILDALEAAGVYANDSQVKELHTFLDEPRPPGAALVSLWPLVTPEMNEWKDRNDLAVLTDLVRLIHDADQILGRRAHADHLGPAKESMLSLLSGVRERSTRMANDLAAGRYSALADPA